MKTLVHYDAAGAIVSSGTIDDVLVERYVDQPGTLITETWVEPLDYYVVDGELVAYTEVERALRHAHPRYPARWDLPTKTWVDLRTTDQLADAVREERTRRLAASDWTQLPDVPLATQAAWATYRQALRDVPEQAGFPTEITWPTPPT